MITPAIIFDGPDGTGKTTQSLLFCSWFHFEARRSVVYCSFPVYEFPMGKIIGRCLGRWGEKEKLQLPSPEDMAVLYSLNRLEALPYLEQLGKMGYLRIFNRGPYGNILNVARRVLIDGINWDKLSSGEKEERINRILRLDQEFFSVIGRESPVVNIFMQLNPEVSAKLARQRALSTLGGEPDEYEKSILLQKLAAQI